MAKTTAELMVKLTADASGLTKTLGDASSSTRQIERSFATLGSSLQGVGKRLTMGLTLPLAALAAVGIKELMEAGKVAAQTNAVLKSTGNVANTSAKQLDEMSAALMRKTGQDDEAIKSGANMMLTFKNVRNEVGAGNDIFDRSIGLATDLSVAFGQDMVTSSKQLGKALGDPITGVTALRKVGVSFSKDQREMIKSLVETGDIAGAQKIILKELETQVGGSAEAYGKTLPGQIAIAKESFTNAAGAIMASFAPAMNIAADVAGGLATTISDLPGPMQTLIGVLALVAGGIGPVIYVVGSLMKAFTGMSALIPKVVGALGSFAGPVAIVAGIVAIALAIDQLSDNGVNAGGNMDELTKKVLTAGSSAAVLSAFEKSASSVKILDAELSKADQELIAFDQLLRKSPESAALLVDAMEEGGGSAGKLRTALDGVRGSQDNANASLEKSENLLKNNAQQTTALFDAKLKLINADLGLQGALLNVESAGNKYNEFLGNGTDLTLEGRQANLSLQTSIFAVAAQVKSKMDADAAANNEIVKSKDVVKAQTTALYDLAGTLQGPARDAVLAYIQQLGNIPGVKNTNVIVDTTGAIWTIENLINKYAGIVFQFGVVTAEGIAAVRGRRAAGGPVSGGSTYLVGEKGPELFTPSGSGVVIPNNKLTGGSSRASGGSTTNININMVAGNAAEIERVVVDALARARRRGLSGVKV